jgi:predicted lipid-binding transport protein (Tim44 family)
MIVEAFAKGEKETLRNLLAEPVYKSFDEALGAREKRGETMSTEILAIRKAEISAAGMKGRMAMITVRFRADETTVTKDAEGAVIAGHPERVIEMKDVWTFGRDTRSRDPRWLVYETSGDEGPDAIPDAR